MTVCAAALCQVRPQGAAYPEDALILISDRMLTSGDYEYETDLKKAFRFSEKIFALGSGDTPSHFTIATETFRVVLQQGITDVAAVAKLYADNFATLRAKRAVGLHLAPFGLDLDTFVSRQREMAPELAGDLYNRLSKENLGVETIIAGVDATGGHIYSVGGFNRDWQEECVESCYDGVGFKAIGSGARQFETEFMSYGYSRFCGFVPALLLACRAKRRAEVSPGVGKQTDIYVVERSRCLSVDAENVAALDRYLDDYTVAAKTKWDEVVERMSKDARIIRQAEQEQEKSPAEAEAIRDAVAAERERCLGWAARAVRELKERLATLEAAGDKIVAARYQSKVATAEDIESAIRSGEKP